MTTDCSARTWTASAMNSLSITTSMYGKDIEHVLHILQTFDPAGVGGRSLQECLLLQVKRLPRGVLRKTMEEVFTDYFDEFTKKHWDKIKAGLELNDTQVEPCRQKSES